MDEGYPILARNARTAFDVALAGALFAAPLFMGGRGPFGKFVFVVFVSLMAIAWLAEILATPSEKREIRWTGAEWIIGGGLLLVIAQLIPLPESILLTISPHMRELLPVWFSSTDPNHVQIGQWQTISLTPDATRQALAIYLSYAMFFLLVVQRLKTLADAERLMRWLAIGTVGLAVLGLAQLLVGNGKFLWVYEHPFRTTDRVVKGPFQNQNHFAHMMALGIGPLIWLLIRVLPGNHKERQGTSRWSNHSKRTGIQRQHRQEPATRAMPLNMLAIAFTIGLVATALMLTLSRGGFVAFAVAGIAAMAIYRLQGVGSRRFWILMAGAAGSVLVALLIHGYQPLATTLSTLRDSRSLEELSSGRNALWSAMSDAIALYWRGGTGIGSHSDVYPMFMEKHYNLDFTHGESGYMPLLMESGVCGVALLTAAIFVASKWLIASARTQTNTNVFESKRIKWLIAPIAASIAASLAHSIGDFVWYITAPMTWTLVLVALASRLPTWHNLTACKNVPRVRKMPAIPFSLVSSHPALCGTFILAAVCFSAGTLLPSARGAIPWNEYRRIVRQADRKNESDLIVSQIKILTTTIAADPSHHNARMLLIANHRRLADTQPMSTAREGENSKIDLDGIGKLANTHALLAITRSPLCGGAYICVAKTLDGKQTREAIAMSDCLLAQARRVRPYDPRLQMVLGKRYFLRGEIEQGFNCWRLSFNQDIHLRTTLINQLHPVFPASLLVEKLAPDRKGLWQLLSAYTASSSQASIDWLINSLIQQIQDDLEADDPKNDRGLCFYELHTLYDRINDRDRSLNMIEQAVACQPNEYRYRRAFALELIENEQFASALEAIRWCQSRNQDDRSLDSILEDCTRRAVASRTNDSLSKSAMSDGLSESHF